MARWYQDERSQDSKGNDRMNSSTWILGQKVSMTKPKADWWSSQDLVSKRSMCNTDHHFQVTRRSLLSKLKKLATGKSEIHHLYSFNHSLWLVRANFLLSGWSIWPLVIKMWQLSHQSHSVPHTIVIASDRPCAFYIVHGDDIFTSLLSSPHEQCTFLSNVTDW